MHIDEAYAADGEVEPAPGSGVPEPGALAHLRWVVAAFEAAQRERVRSEERIRAALRAGEMTRVAPGHGLDHARARAEEVRAQRLMRDCIEAHPAWPWLAGVRGLGHTLAGRLLARLDVTRAPHPSSFWAYCGLSTVPGTTWHCDVCGLSVERAVDRAAGGIHRGSDGVACAGELRPVTAGGRVAQPRPRRGESSPYDREAKALCYLIGASFARQGGAYRDYLEEQMQRLQADRPDWPLRRRQLTAQRKTVKLFLTHLWLVWRGALGLPLTRPHAPGEGHAPAPPSPWSMVEGSPRPAPHPDTRASPPPPER